MHNTVHYCVVVHSAAQPGVENAALRSLLTSVHTLFTGLVSPCFTVQLQCIALKFYADQCSHAVLKKVFTGMQCQLFHLVFTVQLHCIAWRFTLTGSTCHSAALTLQFICAIALSSCTALRCAALHCAVNSQFLKELEVRCITVSH